MIRSHRILSGILLILLFQGFVVHCSAHGLQTPLTFNSNQHSYPTIDGNWVAWEEFDFGAVTIHTYDLSTGTEYVLPHSYDNSHVPFVQGNRIVWTEANTTGYTDLYWGDLPPGPAHYVPTPDSWKTNPVVSANKIVWQDNAFGTDKVLMFDINNGQLYDLAPDAPPDTPQQNPRINGDVVVWQDGRNYADWDIWINNTAIWEQKQVVLDPSNQSFSQTYPAIYGNKIVYQDDRAGIPEIFLYDTTSDTEVGNLTPVDDGFDRQYPDISGDKIIWIDSGGMPPGDYRIALYNLTTGTEYPPPLTDAVQPQYPVRISDDRIVWSETKSGNQNIYLYTEGIQGGCPLPDFTADPVSGSPGLQVNFTDRSIIPPNNPAAQYFWDFADGQTSILRNPANIFALVGSYPVSLTVSNPHCRNKTPMEDRYNITIGPPTAHFTVNPQTGLIPLTVEVTDTSTGSPNAWNWSFGDGSFADTSITTHTYNTKGIYAIRLNVSNSYGTSSAQSSVVAIKGMNDTAYTNINGLTFYYTGEQQGVILDYVILPDWTFLPNTSVLELTPPADRGWKNISIYSLDGKGFTQDPAGHTVYGNVTGVVFQSRDVVLDALSPEIGPDSTFHYNLYHSKYPETAVLNTQIWEGVAGQDLLSFTDIASHAGFGLLSGTAYTVKITKTNLPAGVTARLFMSANASWIEYLTDWRNLTAVPRLSDDRVTGEMLPTVYIAHDPVKNLDFFEVPSPHGLSTFGLSQATERGNPLQLITLTVTSHVNPPSSSPADTDSGMTGEAQKSVVTTITQTSEPTPTNHSPDPGKSAKIYTNAQGIVTQATVLQSADGRATISIPEGVVAKDVGGNPLTEITIQATPQENLPAIPPGSAFTFAGMAYEIGPDGATFSPPGSLSFTFPQAALGQDYAVKSFDKKSGTWRNLPTTLDAAMGTVTVQVSDFCCFALFTHSRVSSITTPSAPPLTVPAAPQVKAQPPTSAVSIFMSMIGWVAGLVMNNVVLLVAVIIITIAIALFMEDKYPRLRR